MIDYEGIIENLQDNAVIQLMTQLGANNHIETDGYIIFPTICHNTHSDEASMKLYYYKNTHVFMCYTECGGMNIFQFLRHYYEARGISYDWYEDVYSVVLNCSVSKDFEGIVDNRITYGERYAGRVQRELPEFPKGVLDVFTKFYPTEWLNDGISKDTMDKFNILYSISQNKIIIPHYDINERLVGIRGRALNEYEIENYGKYMPIKLENTWYKHPLSLNLYGINKNWKNIKENSVCFLFESEKSVLQLDSFERPNCGLAVCGSAFNKYQMNLLLKYCRPKEIVICFDNEEQPNSSNYFDKLWGIGKKYSNYCNFSFIYDRKNITEKKDSPTDKGEAIFEELLQRRIYVK
jgi:hypothetical protein